MEYPKAEREPLNFTFFNRSGIEHYRGMGCSVRADRIGMTLVHHVE